MRIDKFLQISRLIRQRSLANEACDKGLVKINGQTAKASRDVNLNDIVLIRYARKIIQLKILEIPHGNVSKKQAGDLFEVIHEETIDNTW